MSWIFLQRFCGGYVCTKTDEIPVQMTEYNWQLSAAIMLYMDRPFYLHVAYDTQITILPDSWKCPRLVVAYVYVAQYPR